MTVANDRFELSRNSTFRQMVLVAIVKAAIDVSAEARDTPPTDQQTRRANYANRVLLDTERQSQLMAFGVAAQPGINTDIEQVSDGDIEFTVNSLWNAYSGVV